MSLFKTIGFYALADLAKETNEIFILSMPGIGSDVAEILIEAASMMQVHVIIDNSENAVRNGFGDQEALEKLTKNPNIKIYESPENIISFVITNNRGYFIFPQSKVFQSEPIFPNAVLMDFITKEALIKMYYGNEKANANVLNPTLFGAPEGFQKHLEKALEEIGNDENKPQPLDMKKVEENSKNLKINPPLQPDLRREMQVYTTKVQYVELKVKGGKLENAIVKIPENALPVDEKLKELLLTRMKMFKDIKQEEGYKEYEALQKKVDKLRQDFLTPITARSGKNIIIKEKKEDFIAAIDKLKENITLEKKKIIALFDQSMMKNMEVLERELKSFFSTTIDLDSYSSGMKEKKLQAEVYKVMGKIKFPEIEKMVNDIAFQYNFYDLTWNDFEDEKLLKEFKEKKVLKEDDISSIRDLRKAYGVKK